MDSCFDIFNPFPGTELADVAEVEGRLAALRLYRKVTRGGLAQAYEALDFAYALKGVNTVRGYRPRGYRPRGARVELNGIIDGNIVEIADGKE